MARSASIEAAAGGGVWRALGVLPDEKPRVLWGSALFFVVLASASVGLNAADALFFLRYGVATLPQMIMFSGLVVMVVTIGYAAGLTAAGTRIWSWVVMAGFAAWLAAERIAIAADLPGVYPAVWLTGQVVIYVGFTLLWDVAGALSDARQAKRLFPLLTSAGIAGAVTGNALTGPLAGLLGTENLLIVQAAGLGLAGLIARVTTQRFVARRKADSVNVFRELQSGLTTTLRVPLFRLVAGVGAALSVLFFLVFFPFSEVAAASFDTEEALAGFLGLFSSLATAATFLVSLLVANRLFTKLGVVAVLMIVAVIYVAGFSMWLAAFGLFTATLFRGVQWVAVNALAGTAFSSLFNVLTGETRSHVRDFVSAVPVQAGTVLAGGLLLVGANLSATGRTVVSLTIAVAFLLLVLPMRRAYSAALVEAVRHGLADVFTASLPGMQKPHHDADTLSALTAGLEDAKSSRRRVTAAILGDVGGAAAVAALRRLLGDDDATVRLEALASLARVEADSMTPAALRLVRDPSIRVRRHAIALLRRDQSDVPAIEEALEDEDAEVRAQAARIVGGHAGRRVIETMIRDGDAPTIAAALRSVLAEPALADVDARRFIDHPNHAVRAAAAALLAERHDTVALLRSLLDDRSSEVRRAAAHALSQVDRSAIHDVLEHGSVRAREAALQYLTTEEEPDQYLHTWAATELDRAAELRGYREAIAAGMNGASVAAEYLLRVLDKRERMVERWVVTALGTDDTKAALPLVARGAISGDAETKSEALEAIESLTDRALARRLAALLEGSGEPARLYRIQALQDLAADHQHWFRALAARTIFDELSHDIDVATDRAATDDSPVVRTAIPPHSPVRTISTESMTTVDIVLALQQASIFEHLDPEELEALADLAAERSYAPGAVVYEQGSAGSELLVICTGTVTVGVGAGDTARIVAEAGPGEPIGELAVLRRRPRMATVTAGAAGMHALVIGAEDFEALLVDQAELATALMAKLAERIASRVDPDGAPDVTAAGRSA